LWRRFVRIAPARDDDGIGVQQSAESSLRQNAHASGGAEWALLQSADLKGIPAVQLGTPQSKQFDSDAELEGAEPFVGERGHSVQRGSLLFCIFKHWHVIYDNWHSGHWQEHCHTSILE
jgi:hypothetical protein